MKQKIDFSSPSEGKKEKDVKNENINNINIEQKEDVRAYDEIIQVREDVYTADSENSIRVQAMYDALKVHNKVVFDAANALLEKDGSNMTEQEKVLARLSVILHDSGKLKNVDNVMNHHNEGIEVAEEILNKFKGKEIDGLEVDDTVIEKVKNGVERHMNHPFLVGLRGGKKFPTPKNWVDKITHDADLIANVGFKNIIFRVNSKEYFDKDEKLAGENGTTVIEEMVENVMEGKDKDGNPSKRDGVKRLHMRTLTPKGADLAKDKIDKVRAIYKEMKKNGVFQRVQKEFITCVGGETFDYDVVFGARIKIGEYEFKGGEFLSKRLNEEIKIAGLELGYDIDEIKNFEM